MTRVEPFSPTKLQRLMLIGQQLMPASPLYNMAFRFDFHGKLDTDRFKIAFSKIIADHECLRLRLTQSGDLMVADTIEFEMELLDGDPGSQLLDRAKIALDLSQQTFDSCLYRINPEHHVWYLNQHHITTDGAAHVNLFRQLERNYSGQIQTPERTFSHYRQTEIESLDSAEFQSASQYWQQKCTTADAENNLLDLHTQTKRHTLALDTQTNTLLEKAISLPQVRTISQDLTRFSLIAATLLILRYRLFSTSDSTIGTPFHNRQHGDILGPTLVIGFIKVDVTEHNSFADVVRAVQADTMASMKHSLPGISSARINNSFSWLLNFVTTTYGDFADLPCTTTWLHPDAGDAAHALRVQVHDFNKNGHLTLHFDLTTKYFSADQRVRLPLIFQRLLKRCLTNVDLPFSQHALLSEDEISAAKTFNPNATPIPAPSVLELFYSQLQRNPQAVAINDGQQALSYNELDQQANVLSLKLEHASFAPILMGRSLHVIVAILAALKAGVTFIPLEIEHPDKRINTILDQLDNPTLLTTEAHAGRELRCRNKIVVSLDKKQNAKTPDPVSNPIVYIIFTSGTTGLPKGVEITHKSLCNYLCWASKTYKQNQAVTMALYSSLAFDLTLTSLFLPLISGGQVLIYKQNREASQVTVLDVFHDDKVDVVKLTPSHLRLVLRAPKTQRLAINRQTNLQALILGGEDLPRTLAVEAQEQLGLDLQIYNEYGPTEATIGCMIHKFDSTCDITTSVPIGRPITNSQVFLLDNCAQEVPTDFDGKLFLGGGTLARGYLHGTAIAGALYPTNDCARRLPSGDLLYLGRTGAQVKFRGARIETEEIEQAIRDSGLVDEVCVLVTKDDAQKTEILCCQCGISSTVPRTDMDANGICNICREFELKRSNFESYFKDLPVLKKQLQKRIQSPSATACMVLVSGGKDSSYTLCKIVEMGFKPLVFTLDNGYLSEHALSNIERMTQRLQLTWVRECPESMNSIFADSLKRHSNVCDGCFKTIYTLAINYALAHNIPSIITGLSRGQLFETRLMDMVGADVFDEKIIDQRVLQARRAYHKMPDAVSEALDVSATMAYETFEKIAFFDFYRYCDVSLTEMLSFLRDFGGWQRPPDTGRSTNCLINDVGIAVHKRERRHHNYAIPYAWDVRLGHKTKAQAITELNDDIDFSRVEEILQALNYTPLDPDIDTEQQLVAYCTPSRSVEDFASIIRERLAAVLPGYSIPGVFVTLDKMPLTVSGKINQRALPAPTHQAGRYQGAGNKLETTLVSIWQSTFGIERIGIIDNFFDLGGDSIAAVQINVACANAGIRIAATDLFSYPTISALAAIAKSTAVDSDSSNLSAEKEQKMPNTGLAETELSELLARVSDNKKKPESS